MSGGGSGGWDQHHSATAGKDMDIRWIRAAAEGALTLAGTRVRQDGERLACTGALLKATV